MLRLYDIFVNRAIRNPQAIFCDPEEVVDNPWLVSTDKHKILESWSMDQLAVMRHHLQHAAMDASKPPVALYQRIKNAKRVIET
jgi:hypothetical protein